MRKQVSINNSDGELSKPLLLDVSDTDGADIYGEDFKSKEMHMPLYASGFESDSGMQVREVGEENAEDGVEMPRKVMRRGLAQLKPEARAHRRAEKRERRRRMLESMSHRTCQVTNISESIDEKTCLKVLRARGFKPQQYADAIHFKIGDGNVFMFLYGIMVSWNVEQKESDELDSFLPLITGCKVSEDTEEDDFEYVYGDESGIFRDRIVLRTTSVEEKLSVSFALGQSVKLTVYEELVEDHIQMFKHLPEELAHNGRIAMSSKEISQSIGRIFIVKNQVNLTSDILDTPEYFWEDDTYFPLFQRVFNYLEIEKRTRILNRRLDIIGEMLDMLNTESQNKHASKLEWIIIWLIVIEILLEVIWTMLLKDILHVTGDS